VEFLGVVLKGRTVQMDLTKIKEVADWPPPQNLQDVRAFLGFTDFYQYFIPNYSMITRLLIDLTRKAVPFHWDHPQMPGPMEEMQWAKKSWKEGCDECNIQMAFNSKIINW
jgi:hypothetical protein